jgi:hypothetical protein
MASIGDLYYTFRGDGARLQADAKKEGEKAGDTAGKSFAAKFKAGISGKEIGRGFVQGLGLAGALGAANLAATAVQKLTSVMGDAIEAAIQEEASISKLDAALRANVASYDGNTDAIEETLAARMRLGFADDEQRDSLALLVAATKDETKALEVQAAAMDLARLKGITLKEASEALVKVEAGQFRILKSLGIQLPKNATATEALAAVQKVAAGQAEAFANTSGGKLLKAQIAQGEALEKLGGIILPAFVEGTEAAVEVLEAFFTAMEKAGQGAADNSDPMENLANILHDLFKDETQPAKTFLGTLFDGLNDVSQATTDLASNLNDAISFWDQYEDAAVTRLRETSRAAALAAAEVRRGGAHTRSDVEKTGQAFLGLGDNASEAADVVVVSAGKMRDATRKLRDAWLSEVNDLIAGYYDPIELNAERAALAVEEAELRKIVASGKATDEQKADLLEIQRRQEEVLAALGSKSELTMSEISTVIARYQRKVRTATGQAKADIEALIRAWMRLKLAALQASGALDVGAGIGTGTGGRASGGPVTAGVPYTVGEVGKELFVPQTDGYIVPHSQMDTAAAVGGGITVNLIDKMPPVRSVRDIGSQLRDLEYTGYFGGR